MGIFDEIAKAPVERHKYVAELDFLPRDHVKIKAPVKLGILLIVDTARLSGRTLAKALRKYEDYKPLWLCCYDESDPATGKVMFWDEAPKPQHYRHELRSGA